VAFHDCIDDGVERVIREHLASGRLVAVGGVRRTQWFRVVSNDA
jgi:hypothetical protein